MKHTAKKIITAALAALMVIVCSACAVEEPNTEKSETAKKTTSSQASSSSVPVTDAQSENNFSGLVKFMKAKGYISGKPVKMDANFIGAKVGEKYTISFNNNKNNIVIELYEYDKNNMNETAKKVISSVKKDGKFTLLGSNVPAILSDNGKYLMVYTDSVKKNDIEIAHEKEVKKAFKNFKK